MIDQKTKKNNNIFIIAVSLLLAFFCHYAIFSSSYKCYFDDWCDNLYLISYAAHSLKTSLEFPVLLNAETLGSNVYQLYGYTFYSFFGFLSVMFGSIYVVKIAIILFQFFKIYLLFKLLEHKSENTYLKLFIAFIVTWSIYNSSTYFSAGSLPSVFGSEFILIGMLILVDSYQNNRIYSLYSGYVLIITGSLFWPGHIIHALIICLPLFLININKFGIKHHLLILGLACLISLPYLVEIYQFAKLSPNYQLGLGWFDYLDTLKNRLNPYPFNNLNNHKGLIEFDTPFIDTQINIFTPILIVILYFKNKVNVCRLSVIYFVIGVLYLTLSVSKEVISFIPSFLTKLHFHYRYIHYIDSCFLISFLFQLNKSKILNHNFRKIIYIILGMTITSIMIRNDHNNLALGHFPFSNWGEPVANNLGYKSNKAFLKDLFGSELRVKSKIKDKVLFSIPRTAAQTWSYGDLKKREFVAPECNNAFTVNDFNRDMEFKQDCVLKVPVYPFSGNKIYIDRNIINVSDISINNDPLFSNVKVPKGIHTISYQLYKPVVPQSIRSMLLLLWLILNIGLFIMALRKISKTV